MIFMGAEIAFGAPQAATGQVAAAFSDRSSGIGANQLVMRLEAGVGAEIRRLDPAAIYERALAAALLAGQTPDEAAATAEATVTAAITNALQAYMARIISESGASQNVAAEAVENFFSAANTILAGLGFVDRFKSDASPLPGVSAATADAIMAAVTTAVLAAQKNVTMAIRSAVPSSPQTASTRSESNPDPLAPPTVVVIIYRG